MSNHFSADNLKFPGDDRRLDLTDVFVFKSADDPDKTVLIIDSNPTSAPPPIPAPTTGPEFHPGAVYRINIDTDGDAHADVAFTFTFSEYENGTQTGMAWYATGSQARQPEPAGEQLTDSLPVSFDGMARPVQAGPIRISAALRSDPFFADVEGALHGFQWTGHDDFAGNNVDSIALEVPSDMLGDGPVIGVWATISLRRDGSLVQMDRGGHPTINPFINPDGEKNLYNSRQPADDVANYLEPWSTILENAGGYSPEAARAAALRVLPDILRYDRTKPATYPNGRIPTDDVYSARFAWLSNGKIPLAGLKPHDDLQAQFPYLGPPNPQAWEREASERGRGVPTAGSPSGPGSSSGKPGSAGPSRETADAEPPQLFWNTRFPDDKGILLNQPHLVVARAEYLLETALGPEAEPGAETNRQEAAGLLNKEIRYRLEAENGQFRSLDSTEWDIKAVSAPMTCTEAGTDAFRVFYRASQAGQATIRAFLIVDNGSVDQQQIELRVESDGTAIAAAPRTSAIVSPARSVGRSVNSALSPDFRFTIRRWFADLWHKNIQLVDVRLPPELAEQLSLVAADLYRELREVSLACPLQGDPESPLRLSNSDEGKLRLAKAGAELHHRLFREPIRPIEGMFLEGMGEIADRLSGQGTETDPLLLQILAHDYPLPWGLLYDRSGDGGRDLRRADDVDPAGFWGRRFDIYRSVVSVDREVQRGGRRWVKPVIGAYVPRNQEQRDFVDDLRANVGDALLDVDGTSSTVDDLKDWTMSGKDSDLVYLFCHARPARYDGQKAGTATSWLGFGSSEVDDRDELRAGLDQLGHWWNEQRPTNPIVILNACSSGQQDLIYGAPFVEFFLQKWGAQAFIGTDWPINASFADMFGRRMLYEILQHRRSLRDAFRSVSDQAAADSNYFPLMYAVYGLNTVQFIDPVQAMLRARLPVKLAFRTGPP